MCVFVCSCMHALVCGCVCVDVCECECGTLSEVNREAHMHSCQMSSLHKRFTIRFGALLLPPCLLLCTASPGVFLSLGNLCLFFSPLLSSPLLSFPFLSSP